MEVLGLQSGVCGDWRLRPQLAHKAQKGTAVPSLEGTYTPSCTVSRTVRPNTNTSNRTNRTEQNTNTIRFARKLEYAKLPSRRD